MFVNKSPWLAQVKRTRKAKQMTENIHTDVTIIGGGIAGVMTAYYILKDTQLSVTILEKNTVASGATGHNAGQIASYFEKPFMTLVKEYGFKVAAQAQRDVLSAWDLLDHVLHEAEIKHRPESFAGFAGCSTVEQLLAHLKNNFARRKANIHMDHAYVLNDPAILQQIPKKYRPFYSIVDRESIAKKIETDDTQYIAVLTVRKGVLNSARFCEEIVDHLTKKYPHRFLIYENTKVQAVQLGEPLRVHAHHTVSSMHVIFCTNGFTPIEVLTEGGQAVEFPHSFVHGVVGQMTAYLSKNRREPSAISYFPKSARHGIDDPYFYVTNRHYDERTTMLCTGGPEKILKIGERFHYLHDYIPDAVENVKRFLEATFKKKYGTPDFRWQGVMGYTETGVRCIGRSPKYNRLFYNLGCNGIGILPSIFGAKKISLLLQGVKFKKSIFDPHWHFRTVKRSKKQRRQFNWLVE